MTTCVLPLFASVRGVSSFLKIMSRPVGQPKAQKFEYFLVMDFEANCQQGLRLDPQEVIEFPCLLVRASDFTVQDQFHEYIRPVGIPNLTHFCTELTGITQDMVEDKEPFPAVLSQFEAWYSGHNLSPDMATFVTCGQWDLVDMLPKQCKYSAIPVPQMLDVGKTGEFVNIKFSFQEETRKYGKGLKDMQKVLGLTFVGRHHSGIDDCKNILLVMQALAKNGAVFANNGMNKSIK